MKKTKVIGKVFLFGLFALMFAISIGSANAATAPYQLNDVLSGVAPGGPTPSTPPWISATFDDNTGNSNSVFLTMTAENLTGSENITQWYFNFDDVLDVALLSFAEVGTSNVSPINVQTGMNNFKADGDGWFDILFDFPPPPGMSDGRFNSVNDTVQYEITHNTTTIDALDFIFDSAQFKSKPDSVGYVGYKSVAHVQSIECEFPNDPETCPTGTISGWLATTQVVPEPLSSTLFIVGAATLGFRRFRKTRKK